MLTPSYLLHAPEAAEEIAEQLHIDILNRIIERIMIRLDRKDGYVLTALDKWQIETLQQAGFLLSDIQKEIAKATKKMETEIAEAMEDAGVSTLEYDDRIYREAGIEPVSLTQSPAMIAVMQRNYEATAGEWKNFTRSTAEASQTIFFQACDKAYNLAMSGAISSAQAVQEILNDVIKNGVYVQYPAGHRDTIETAATRAVRTGISQASAQIQMQRMDEYGWDLVLVSSHLGARPSHAVWQGKVYSRSGKSDQYPGLEESTGYGTVTGLCGANCRHNMSPWREGMGNPFEQYDSEDNLKQYEIDQQQRAMERRIRDTKRQTMAWHTAAESAETEEAREKAKQKYQRMAALLQRRNEAYNEYCDANGLKRRQDRISIAKWGRTQAAQARNAAKQHAKQLETDK